MAIALAALWLSACATAPAPSPSLDDDPLEADNRQAHALNLALDRAAYGPAARAYGSILPEPVRNGVTNFVNHISLPAVALQYGLQGRPVRVLESSMRFAINSTFGLGGVLDPAAEMDLPYRESDVDETFYAWGFELCSAFAGDVKGRGGSFGRSRRNHAQSIYQRRGG